MAITNNTIPLDRQNMVINGMTRSGKTYGVKTTLKAASGAVLLFNPQHEKVVGFTRCDMHDDLEDIMAGLRQGVKINYVPDTRPKVKDQEFNALVDALYREGKGQDVYFVADECHLYGKEAEQSLVRLATTGISWGITTISISQRAAAMNYTVLTQSPVKVFYELDHMDVEYYRAKKFPIDEMMGKIKSEKSPTQIPGHSPYLGNYVIFERNEVKGPFRV